MIFETFWRSLTRLSRLLKVSSRPRLSRLVNTSYDLGSITIFMEFSIWLQMYAGFLLSWLFPPSLQNVLLFVNEGIVRVGDFCYDESIYNCSSKKNIVHVEFSMKYFNMTHLQLQQNSSEIRGLCFMKCHLPFFQRKKTQSFFSFSNLRNFEFWTV